MLLNCVTLFRHDYFSSYVDCVSHVQQTKHINSKGRRLSRTHNATGSSRSVPISMCPHPDIYMSPSRCVPNNLKMKREIWHQLYISSSPLFFCVTAIASIAWCSQDTIQYNTINLYYLFREMCLQWDKNNLQTHLHTGLHTHTCILTLNNYNNNSTVLEHEVRKIIAA